MKTYYIADSEHSDAIYGDQLPACIDMAEVIRLAREWDMTTDELLDQMHEASADDIAEYGAYDSERQALIYPAGYKYAIMHESCEFFSKTVPATVDDLFALYNSLSDFNQKPVEVFDTEEAARAALARYRCQAWKEGTAHGQSVIRAELYWLERGEWDEDFDSFADYSEVVEYASLAE